jgi:phage repressor protein C with HTH and peptisase S24 domain
MDGSFQIRKIQSMSNRIRHWRHRDGLTLEQLAERTGLSVGTVSKLESGKMKLTQDYLSQLAPALRCAPAELLPLIDLPSHLRQAPSGVSDEFTLIPVRDVRAAAGAGAVVDSEAEIHRVAFRQEWLRSVTTATPEQLTVIQVDGDSMWPTLNDGDHVLVDTTQQSIGRDGLYVLRSGDEVQVKRVQIDPESGLLTILSDNAAYRSHEGVDPTKISVRGRVIWVGRRV